MEESVTKMLQNIWFEFLLLSIRNSSYRNLFRWVIPVLPGGELEVLLEHSIDLCRWSGLQHQYQLISWFWDKKFPGKNVSIFLSFRRGVDTQSEPCQRFFRDGLTISFTKIMTDEAVSSWRLGEQIYLTSIQFCYLGSTYTSAFWRIVSVWLNW